MFLLKIIEFIFGFVLLLLVSTVSMADTDERYRQAGHPATQADIFRQLMLDKDAAIRKRVASNRKTPIDVCSTA